jgi:hypothetical protein
VVTQGSLSDGHVPIPQSSLDDAHGFAHLYILAEVKEEANQVTVLCGLRRDRLLAHHHQAQLTATAEGTYTIPVALFDTLPDDILLYLNCLNPAQVAEASPAVGRSPLAQPEPQTINVGRWLQDQIDSLANTVTNTLTWALLPPLSISHAMMSAHSPAETLETVLRELEPAGVTIPAEARGAYTDLQPMGLPLRLYALTWTVMADPQPEWSLFLVLGPAPGEQVPPGTRLIVRDAASTLADSILTAAAHTNHLYAQVFGIWDEAFTVTIELPNGGTLNWPPFVFRPEE